MRKIRVLHVFGSTFCGGAEKRTLEVMKHMDSNLYQFDICSLLKHKGTLDSEIRDLGSQIFYLSKKDMRFKKHFGQILRDGSYDVVHSHVYPFSGYILYLAYKAGISKRIIHFRSTYREKRSWRKKFFYRIMNRWIYKYATHILSVSHSSMDSVWKKHLDARCQVVYHGVKPNHKNKSNIHRDFNIGNTHLIVTHVGNMVPAKNHSFILEVFYAIQKSREATLLLVGRKTPEIYKKLLGICEKLNIRDKVIFAGHQSDIYSLLNASNIFIFPSLFEGLPGAILEACNANLPILASNIPSICEIAQHCSCIHCLPLDASPRQWAEKALEICQQKYTIELSQTPFCFTKNIEIMHTIYT